MIYKNEIHDLTNIAKIYSFNTNTVIQKYYESIMDGTYTEQQLAAGTALNMEQIGNQQMPGMGVDSNSSVSNLTDNLSQNLKYDQYGNFNFGNNTQHDQNSEQTQQNNFGGNNNGSFNNNPNNGRF